MFLIQFTIISLGLSSVSAQKDYGISFDHVALSVKDLDASAQFYAEILKLPEIDNKTQNPAIRWFSLGQGKELHLISTIKDPVTINKAVHFAVTTTQFTELVDNLISQNIEYSDWPGTIGKISIRPDGIQQVFIQDPDGYWIEINSTALSK